MTNTLPYIGGPRNDKFLDRTTSMTQWPPRTVACYDEIPIGSLIGLYRLHGQRLCWELVQPVRAKPDLR